MTATPPPPAIRRKPSALAVAALILGIGGFVPILGILLGGAGIVLGIVVLARNAGGRDFAIAGIVAALVGTINVHVWLLPGLTCKSEQLKQARCVFNLNGIGEGIFEYAQKNQGAYPPDLEVLVRQRLVTRNRLQCPGAEGNRLCDYFYLAPSGDPADVPRDLLMACDLRDNHGEGREALYAYGNVRSLTEVEFQAELAKPVNAAFAAALRKAEGE